MGDMLSVTNMNVGLKQNGNIFMPFGRASLLPLSEGFVRWRYEFVKMNSTNVSEIVVMLG